MSDTTAVAPSFPSEVPRSAGHGRRNRWLPSPALVSTKLLELRKRTGLMVVVILLTLGLPVIVLGIRLLFHVVDPHSYGPAGSPSVFAALCNPMAEFGFIAGAALGATAGTTDLSDGMFRHLVVTGRSRVALYLARIPAGLAVLMPSVAVGFAVLCVVTAFAGSPQPTHVSVDGVAVPLGLTESQLETWLLEHPDRAASVVEGRGAPVAVGAGGLGGRSGTVASGPRTRRAATGRIDTVVRRDIGGLYPIYASDEQALRNPAANEMVKIGLWIELDVAIGFMVGLGLGALIGQRTLATVLMIVLELIVTPILANVTIPYFVNGQRLLVGVAMDQLRPAALAGDLVNGGHGRVLFGGRASLGIAAMPTWAMVGVIVGWIVGFSFLGAWQMTTRDA